jgi:hypothetical protein
MSEMIAFPSIESFRHVVKTVGFERGGDGLPLPTVRYAGTCKLHGSNAGIVLKENGQIIPQSRNRVLSVGDDNFGFAAFVEKNRELLEVLLNELCMEEFDYTLYGEWCGGNIQPKVALEKLDKHFVIFTVYSHHDQWMFPSYTLDVNGYKVDYARLNAAGIYFIHQIPSHEIVVDFNRPEDVVDQLSELTLAVERECPWGKFRGVSGIGEGIVWAPVDTSLPFEWWFKTKGLDHKRDPKPAKVEIAAEVLKDQQALAEKLLPEWRLEQGISVLRERGLSVEPKNIGVYLKWIGDDVQKEEQDTMEANGTDWKTINPMVLQRARQYILELCKKF